MVAEETLASPEEIEALVNVGDSEEILEKEERDMIYRILDLPDTVAREVMVPRTDIVCLDVSANMDEILETVVLSRHSRIPVYEATIDNIVGILHVKDMFEFWRTKQPINLHEIIVNRPPFFTPESKKIRDLLQELRANKQRMTIIVDEYGGTAGLLTTEDIIEEIVGEMQDEDETGEEGFEIQYIVDANTDISKLNELLGANLSAESTNSVERFIVDFLGRIPKASETFEYQDLHFSILESNKEKILRVGIVKKLQLLEAIQYESKTDEEWFQLRYFVDARMDIHELNELLGTNLTSESVDTIGGFIIDLLGEVPEKNRTFEYQGLQFSVLEADEKRILRVAIIKNTGT
jgi:putative hemolysin